MDPNDEYLLYLENRIHRRENSRSYRWTSPARKLWNIFHPVTPSSYERHFDTIFSSRLVCQHDINKADFNIIKKSEEFSADYACPWTKGNRDKAIRSYMDRWRRRMYIRKPCPGFHPGIYASINEDCSGDPFAHYLLSGKPAGPWSQPLLSPSKGIRSRENDSKIALHLHIYYPEQLDSLCKRLELNQSRPDLYVSTSTDDDSEVIESKFNLLGFPRVVVRRFPNRGRNFGPLFTGFREIFESYDIIGHFHTKQSPHVENREEVKVWSDFLYANLLSDEYPMLDCILDEMASDQSLGLVYADEPNVFGWSDNVPYAQKLAQQMKLSHFKTVKYFNFPAGSMFWFKPKALKPFFELNLSWEDYPSEPIGDDGTILHAMERLIPFVVQHSGFNTAVTSVQSTGR